MSCFIAHDRVAYLRESQLVAMGQNRIILTQAACIGINVRLPDLKYIEHVLHIQCDLSGFNCSSTYLIGEPVNKKIVGNIVGMSLYVVTNGTTLTVTVIALGPP